MSDRDQRVIQLMTFNFMLALGVVAVIEWGDALIFGLSAALGAGVVYILHRRWSRD